MLIQSFPHGGGGGSTGVTSFNGRTGVVTPQNGDYTKEQVGLGNVDNTADTDKPISTATQTALNGKIASTEKGTANGVATLDSNGKIPSSQLPSYVDDVIEGYYDSVTDRFYEENTFITIITPIEGKSWVDVSSNKSYRWTGSVYARVDEGVQLGEVENSAYRGDRGKAAYDHSQLTSGNPHNVTKSDVGLANVDNTSDLNKPISTATQTALNGKVDSSEKGAANGIATLDANGKVPSSQIPGGGGGGSSVTPNPAGAATADLEKVDIDGTVFNVLANAVHKTGDESIAGTKTFTGNVVCTNPIMVQGADYAEKFKTLENIPLYRFVTLDGEYAKLAQRNDYVLGVTSNTPGILGNILVDEGIAVGLVGQLWVEQDGTAEINDFVTSGDLGVATKAAVGYRVMAVNGSKCKILFR